jgi:hypothetical protein
VQEAAESIPADDRGVGVNGWMGGWPQWRGLPQSTVGSVGVEMVFVLAQHSDGVSRVEEEDPVQQFSPDTADESLADGVRSRCPDRDLDDVGAGRGEHVGRTPV